MLFDLLCIAGQLNDLLISQAGTLSHVFWHVALLNPAAWEPDQFNVLVVDRLAADLHGFLVNFKVVRSNRPLNDVFAQAP